MKERKNKIPTVRKVFMVLAVVCMVCIFIFSMENADNSSRTSGNVIRFFAGHFYPNFNLLSAVKQREIISSFQFLARKLAHFSVYFLLGFLLSVGFGKRKLFTRTSLYVVIIGFCYAVSDEIHQIFVPGRSCQFRDMMIDTGGVCTGILFSMAVFAIHTLIFRKKNK